MSQTVPGRPRVLVIDDLPQIVRLLTLELSSQGFDVFGTEIGEDVFLAMEEYNPDIVLLEIILPGLSGYELLRQLKERYPGTPCVFLTTRGSDADRLEGLEFGADDVIGKPFDPEDLALRLNTLLRPEDQAPFGQRVLHDGDLAIDLNRKIAKRGRRPIILGTNEWALLYELGTRRGERIRSTDILGAVWDPEYATETRFLEVWIRRLRERLEKDPDHPQLIVGDVDSGFMLVVEPDGE